MYQDVKYEVKQETKHTSVYSAEHSRIVELTAELPQVKMRLVHLVSKGFYARVLHVPAGTLVMGKTHKRCHYMSLVTGVARVLEADVITYMLGPEARTSKEGTQRMVYAVTDCAFFTLHQTTKTTIAEIEADIV